MHRFASVALLGALAFGAPAVAVEAQDKGVAAAGTCAEPRRFDGSGCTDCPSASAADESDFSVAGPARGRFSPTDVAAPPAPAAAAAPPEIGGFAGRGPCDTPGSCTGAVAPAPPGRTTPGGGAGGLTVVERPPRPGGPPGTR
jgi:hypothetical protein